MEKNENKTIPFIMQFAKTRKEMPFPPAGEYDEQLKIVVMKDGDKKIPLIRGGLKNPAILTKTEQYVESDDLEKNYFLELMTKTRQERESDDQNFLPELFTKTKIDRESDDESFEV